MKYYSIRIVNAENRQDAIEQVIENFFDESDNLCDRVMTAKELYDVFKKILNEKEHDREEEHERRVDRKEASIRANEKGHGKNNRCVTKR